MNILEHRSRKLLGLVRETIRRKHYSKHVLRPCSGRTVIFLSLLQVSIPSAMAALSLPGALRQSLFLRFAQDKL